MQHPVQGYTAGGFIWYQGCSNVQSYSTYAGRLKDMVALWRKDWGDFKSGNLKSTEELQVTPFELTLTSSSD